MGQPSQRMQQRREALFDDIVQYIKAELTEQGYSANAALLGGSACADKLAQYWSGQVISIPKDSRGKLMRLEVEIYNKFDGRNVPELALEYDLTERGMYKLLARVRKRLRENAQPGLFDDCLSAA